MLHRVDFNYPRQTSYVYDIGQLRLHLALQIFQDFRGGSVQKLRPGSQGSLKAILQSSVGTKANGPACGRPVTNNLYVEFSHPNCNVRATASDHGGPCDNAAAAAVNAAADDHDYVEFCQQTKMRQPTSQSQGRLPGPLAGPAC
jgi:hypothetical protein